MIKIGIAGSMSRIGTTTQAIQLAQVLKENYKICYVERNEKKYLNDLVNLYTTAKNKKAKIEYSGLEMYKNLPNLDNSLSKYDFVISDFGNINTRTFEEKSFKEQDIKIIISGSKPNEIFKTQVLLERSMYKDANFVFVFVPEEERVSIASLMRERRDKTYFSDIVLDPYKLENSSKQLYTRILYSSLDMIDDI